MNGPARVVGWREWIKLPDLGIPGIKAKIDTGAKTSCLHAFEVETRPGAEGEIVFFKIHPLRKRRDIEISCEAPLVDRRAVRDSGGHVEERIVISTRLEFGDITMEAEFTLTSRDDMIFPMLLGRRALQAGDIVVDVNESYVHGRLKTRHYEKYLEELS